MKHNDGPCVVTKIKADDITMEMFKKYNENMIENVAAMDPNIKMTQLKNDGGCKIMHVDYKIPGMAAWLVSNRTFYIAFYDEDLEDGHLTLDTTQGNDHIAAANKALTGKNVLGTVTVEYLKTTFLEGGTGVRFIKVNQAHAGGNLPRGKYLPTKEILRDSRKEIEGMIEFMRKMK